MRRTALPIAVILLAALAAAVALGRVGDGPDGARAAVVASAGDIEIANDRDGLPVFAAAGIGPGDSARGTVEIAATGSEPVELSLSRHDLLDTPGLGGGLLSQALTLTVTDVTAPAAPLAVYDGPLATMPAQPAGRIEPGASRTFAFVAILPAGGGDAGATGGASGAGDQNALQGASVSVAYSWTASEVEGEPGPGDEPGSPGGGGAPGAGEGPDGPRADHSSVQPPGDAPPSATSAPIPGDAFALRVARAAKALRSGRLLVWAGCERACAITVRGRLRATAAGHHRGVRLRFGARAHYRPGMQPLRIRVPGKLRRWLATAPGKRRLRATLTFTATDRLGARDTVTRKLKLKPPRRR